MFPTHLHLPPLFPAIYVYIITLLVFCKTIFSLMRTQDWVETSELPDNNICLAFLASGVSPLIIMFLHAMPIECALKMMF